MKAVILAAGKGTRMKELTNEVPKPMLRVEGRPILEHILGGLIGAGIRDICIVTGWHAEASEYFGDGGRWNCQIRYVRQVVRDGTGRPLSPPGHSSARMFSVDLRRHLVTRDLSRMLAHSAKPHLTGCSRSPPARTSPKKPSISSIRHSA